MRTDDHFYSDLRYCPRCQSYVRYLSAWDKSYCVQCRDVVRIFSDEDLVWLRRGTHSGDPLAALSRRELFDDAS